MPLVLAGATSGQATLQATDAATVTLTLPATSGTLLSSGGSGSFSTLTVTGDAVIDGVTVGQGGGNLALNTVVGAGALASVNTGDGQCSAFGFQVLNANTSGAYNTGVGLQALLSNTTGSSNISIGGASLRTNTTGNQNTGVGFQALNANTTASNNTAVGYQASYSNTTGILNVAVGYRALYSTTTQNQNVAVGADAFYSNTTGYFGVAVGYRAGESNTTGFNNTVIGRDAGRYITTGSKNTIIGSYDGNQGGLDIRTLSNYIVLSDGDGNVKQVIDPQGCVVIPGYGAPNVVRTADASLSVYKNVNTLRVAHFQNNFNTSGAENVRTVLGSNCDNTASYHWIASTGTSDKYYLYGNGTFATVSDQRLKKNIEDAKEGYLDDVMKLRVVKYNWAEDAENTPKELGWIAQEVEQVFPRLVQDCLPNEDGDIYKTVKTSVLPHILLKAMQEQQAIITDLKARIETLENK